jgi:AcrR family transcriptional regulator
VALAIGAPSGSVYHRFPGRDDLVAGAWLRAQDRFLDAVLAPLGQASAGSDVGVCLSVDAAVDAAAAVPTWSLAHRDDAGLLLRYGLGDLLRGQVSTGLAEHAKANQARVVTAIDELRATIDRPLPDVTLAVVDLPYAVTRRLLRGPAQDANGEVTSLRRSVRLLLSTRP